MTNGYVEQLDAVSGVAYQLKVPDDDSNRYMHVDKSTGIWTLKFSKRGRHCGAGAGCKNV